MIVVDASALLEVLLRSTLALAAEARLFAPGESLNAPHLLAVEVVQPLTRYCGAGALDPKRAEQALADLADLPSPVIRTTCLLTACGSCATT